MTTNTDKLAEALRRLLDASMVAMTDESLETAETVAAWNAGQEALAAHRAEQASQGPAEGDARVGVKLGANNTVTVYDLRPSLNPDSAISAKLVELGWTPPGQASAAKAAPAPSAEQAAPMLLGDAFDRAAFAEAERAEQAAPVGEREAFDAWFEQISGPLDDSDAMWLAWQARAALTAAQPKAQGEPVAWMCDFWGSDCGPYYEIHKAADMGWRGKEGWTPLYAAPQPKAPEPLTDEQIDRAITELGLDYLARLESNRAVLRNLCRRANAAMKEGGNV